MRGLIASRGACRSGEREGTASDQPMPAIRPRTVSRERGAERLQRVSGSDGLPGHARLLDGDRRLLAAAAPEDR